MLRQILPKVLSTHTHFYSTAASSSRGKWNLVSSVCLLRKPVIAKEMTDFEKQVQKLLFEIEIEASWKSDWELEIEKDFRDLEQIKGGDSSKIGRKLCSDWEDEWKAELANMKLEPRVTPADSSNDLKSWNRSLDRSLAFVVQQEKCGSRWIFPHGIRAEGETMRQTAERVLQESCGGDLKVQFYGNAPSGYFKFKYPQNVREKEGVDGDKVFFYKAYLVGGQLKSSSMLKDFKWVGQNELSSTLPPDYCRSVEMFLFDES